jgi:hypothetical protein
MPMNHHFPRGWETGERVYFLHILEAVYHALNLLKITS